MNKRSTWIFGYGSLMWRPGFQSAERRPVELSGWSRCLRELDFIEGYERCESS